MKYPMGDSDGTSLAKSHHGVLWEYRSIVGDWTSKSDQVNLSEVESGHVYRHLHRYINVLAQ